MSPIGIGQGKPAPVGPLLGSELSAAIELLTAKQLRAYRYRREGHAWNWIAQRMGISRPAVIHHVAKAEKRLGYAPTVTAKQKASYKSEPTRQAERELAWDLYVREHLAQMPESDRKRLIHILKTSRSEAELRRRLGQRERQFQRERARELEAQRAEARAEMDGLTGRYLDGDNDDWSSSARKRGDVDLAIEMNADLGSDLTGAPLRATDLVVDDGKGHDRL